MSRHDAVELAGLGVGSALVELQEFALAECEGNSVLFFFLSEPPVKADLPEQKAFATESETFELHGQVFCLHAPDVIGRSKLAAKAECLLAVSATGRNLNTVRKVLAL